MQFCGAQSAGGNRERHGMATKTSILAAKRQIKNTHELSRIVAQERPAMVIDEAFLKYFHHGYFQIKNIYLE